MACLEGLQVVLCLVWPEHSGLTLPSSIGLVRNFEALPADEGGGGTPHILETLLAGTRLWQCHVGPVALTPRPSQA